MGTLFTALGAAAALSNSNIFPVHQGGARALGATGTQLLALVGTAYVPLAGGTMTGALTLPAGTVSAPSLMFTGAGADTGIYSAGANNLSFAVSGVRQGYFVSGTLWMNGNFGLLNNAGGLRFGSASNDDPLLIRFGNDAVQLVPASTTSTCNFVIATLGGASVTNYERLSLTGVAGASVNITAESLGTGSSNLDVVITPKGTGNVRFPSGTYDKPGIVFNAYPTTGFWLNSGGTSIYMTIAGAAALKVDATTIGFHSAGVLSWSSSGVAGQNSPDTGFSRNAAGVVEFNNGTAGTFRDVKLRNLLAGGGNRSYVQTPSMTVANLAAAETAGAGARAFVTDANATTFLSTVAAGGSNKVPVVSDGANWLIG